MMPPPRLHDLGWLEYHLPDGSFYYVHPTRKVTTDVNLRDEKVLSEVTVYLEDGYVFLFNTLFLIRFSLMMGF